MGLSYQEVFENNRKWAAGKKASDSEFFARLAGEQHPDFLFIGCSDSRVSAELLMGAQPGEVFVHRNIANQVSLSDPSALSVIHFAVDQLQVKHIVVCGHYMCGGVQLAMKPGGNGPLDSWLKFIREVAMKNRRELEEINDVDVRLLRLVELNVEAQCSNVLKLDVVKESIRNQGKPAVHGWVYDVRSGELRDLNFLYGPGLNEQEA